MQNQVFWEGGKGPKLSTLTKPYFRQLLDEAFRLYVYRGSVSSDLKTVSLLRKSFNRRFKPVSSQVGFVTLTDEACEQLEAMAIDACKVLPRRQPTEAVLTDLDVLLIESLHREGWSKDRIARQLKRPLDLIADVLS